MRAQTSTTNTPVDASVKRLLGILALKRGHNTKGERDAIARFLSPYSPTMFVDAKASRLAYVLRTDPTSTTLFSCHVDTVHHNSDTESKNHVVYDANLGIAYKDKTDPTPLGADDGAGWWLMLEMYDAGVPGTYVFHVGEECGGIGSKGMALHHRNFLSQFKRAVAFDRRGTTSVITEQARGECCSTVFARTLADRLNEQNPVFTFSPDDTGIYTDTAEYIGIIPECTNVSCGYQNEHSSSETLDVEFLTQLRDACIALDWESLPVERDPSKPATSRYGYGSFGSWGSSKVEQYGWIDEFDIAKMRFGDVRKWVKNNPDEAADLLIDLADRMVDMSVQTAHEEEELPDLERVFGSDNRWF